MQAVSIFISIIIGGIYAALLYFNDKRGSLDPKIRMFGAILRFSLIALTVWLITSPAISFLRHTQVKPSLIVAVDQSQSMISQPDSNSVKTEIPEQITELQKNLSDDYDIRIINFSNQVNQGLSNEFTGKQTNISAVLDYARIIGSSSSNTNLLLISDGIYNQGGDPRFELSGSNLKIYTLAYGDTTLFADAKIESINSNKYAQVDITTPIEFSVSFTGLKGKKGNIWVEADSKKIFDQSIDITKSSSLLQFTANFTPSKKGIVRIKVCVSPFSNERNSTNNCREVYIEVTDNKPRVLIAGSVPHPDLGAIRQAIANHDQFIAEMKLPPFSNDDLNDVAVLIAHQLPGNNGQGDQLVSLALQKKIPILFIIGQTSDIKKFNDLDLGATLSTSNNFIEAYPYLAPNFDLFHEEQSWKNLFSSLPPLTTPAGNFKITAELKPFLLQKINNIETERPLLVLGQSEGIRLGILFGEGFWQQRIYGYSSVDNHEQVDSWLIKTIQFINMKEPQSRLKVVPPEDINRYTPLVLKAFLKNKSGELTNEPEVKIELNSDSITKPLSFIFGKEVSSYVLDAGRLSAGKWNWKASTKEGGEDITSNGILIVKDFNAELMQTQANHLLLKSLAHQQQGKYYTHSQWEKLFNDLKDKDNTTREIITERETEEPIRFTWIFILIVLLMTAEWFLRKYNGSI